MTTTTTPSPTCRDCGGIGRIRKVTIGRPPGANTETVACPCTSGHESRTVDGYHYTAAELTEAAATALPTTNPYAEERARAESLLSAGYPALAAAARGELDPNVRRRFSIAIRRSVAAMDLIDDGVDVSRFATGDLLAHYDRVVGPRAGANLAKQREAKAEEKARRDADRPPASGSWLDGWDEDREALHERIVGGAIDRAWTTFRPEGHDPDVPRFRPVVKSIVDEATGAPMPMPVSDVSAPTQHPRTFAVGDRVLVVAPDSRGTGTVRTVDWGMYGVDSDVYSGRRAYGWPALVHLIGEDAYPEAVTRDEAWDLRLAAVVGNDHDWAPARIPDDHLLTAIARTDGDS